MLQPLEGQADLIPDRHLPGEGVAELGEVEINFQRVQVIALVVKLIGDFIASALLPVAPGLRAGFSGALLALQQPDDLLERVVLAAELGEGGGKQEADRGLIRGVRITL